MNSRKLQGYAFLIIPLVLLAACARIGAGTGEPVPTAASPSPDPCGAIGTVQAAFDLPHGMDFWDVFPNAGLAPELGGQSGLHLIVYQGPVELTNVSGIPDVARETTVNDAVCVVMPNGDANLYYDIPRAGMKLPDLPSLSP